MTDPSSYWSRPPEGSDPHPGTPLAAPGARRSAAPVVALVVAALLVPACALVLFAGGTVRRTATGSRAVGGSTLLTIAPASPARPAQVVGLGVVQRWRSLGVSLACDRNGSWRGTAQLRNDATMARSGAFSWTVRRGAAVVATLRAAAAGVAPGRTVGVAVHAAERCAPGPVTATFRVDASV